MLINGVTVTVKVEVPVALGVPEIVPLPELMESPSGRLPLVMLHAYGCTPPLAATVWL